MGILSKLFLVFLPGLGVSTFFVLKLGNRLPVATRRTGQNIGMLHNYLRVLIRHLTPRSMPAVEMVRKIRQTNQQAFAFSNEIKWNLLETHTELKQSLPDLTHNPLDKFKLDSPKPKVQVSKTTQDLADLFKK